MSLGFPYNGAFIAQQDYDYEPQMCPIRKTWRRTHRVLLNTWTIYEFVGKPRYMTPRFFLNNEDEARTKLSEL